MATFIKNVPWKFALLVSVWFEMFCVDSHPLFLLRGRPVVQELDMLQSETTIADPETLSKLTKSLEDPDIRNLNKTMLLAKLGGNFDSFYMSVDPPVTSNSEKGIDISMRSASIERKNFAMSKMPRRLRQLQFKVTRGERRRSRFLGYRASSKLRQWLWELSRCPINYTWAKYDLNIFPRYIRFGRCMKKPCSFPSGMSCQPKSSKTLKMLIWTCLPGKGCDWRTLLLRVNETCKCSCSKD